MEETINHLLPMNPQYTAQKLTISQENQTLAIEWKDEHITTFPLDGLRKACPCVVCQGGHANMGKPVDPMIFKVPATQTWTIKRIEQVGNYAIRIFWNDGHNDGIYGWQRLREMCPCEVCVPA